MSDDKRTPPGIREFPVTYETYANMPDDGNRYEIDDGVLELMSPGPNSVHQLVLNALLDQLKRDCQNDYIILFAPLDVILSQTEVRQPDLILIHKSRHSIITYRGVEGPPDLVVEISTVDSLRRDRVRKTKAYAKHGVPEYWIVDLGNYALEQYILQGSQYELHELYHGDQVIRSEMLPCASFTINEIIRSIPYMPKRPDDTA